MAGEQIPPGLWGWRTTALLLMVVVVPQLAALELLPEARSLSAAASTTGLITYPVLVGTAVMTYFHWRLDDGDTTAWLIAGLSMTAVQGAGTAAFLAAREGSADEGRGWLMAVELAFALGLLAMARLARSYRLPLDPVALGLTLGFLVTGVRFVLLQQAPALRLTAATLSVLSVVVLALTLAVAWAIYRGLERPSWARARLALGVCLISVSHAAVYPAPENPTRNLIALAADTAGAVLLCGTALALLRLSIRNSRHELAVAQQRLDEVGEGMRLDRERLHEIGSIIAGISSASRMIHHNSDTLSSHKRFLLEEMLEAETSRLERLVSNRQPVEVRDIDLDGVIASLVVAHQAKGHLVHWSPSGLRAMGRSDDVAEVVNILLDNAARHGPATGTRVEVRPGEGTVQIVVSDSGPGVPPEIRSRLFEWGERGPDSPGQGIGLHVAHRLIHDLGGSLELADNPPPGATFVVRLNAPRSASEPSDAPE